MRLDRFSNRQTGFGPWVATTMALVALGALIGGILVRLAELIH